MYGVHIKFKDGSSPYSRFDMTRKQYGEEMQKWKVHYKLELETAEDLSNGDKLIFFNAEDAVEAVLRRKREEAKSRSRYYSKGDRDSNTSSSE